MNAQAVVWSETELREIKPAARAAKTIEDRRENICKVLDVAKDAYRQGIPHRCLKEEGDDVLISIFCSTKRLPLDKQGKLNSYPAKKKTVIPTIDMLQRETRAGRFDTAIAAESQKRSDARKGKGTRKEAA